MSANVRMSLLIASLGIALMIAPTHGQGLTVELSPDMAFEDTCTIKAEVLPNPDWKMWQGGALPASTQDMLRSAGIYQRGTHDTVRDRDLALRMLQHLSASAAPEASKASIELARMLLDGAWPQFDPQAAMRLLQQRASLGDLNAVAELGSIYSLGGPVPQDDNMAIRYLQQAAGAQDITAIYRLSQIYARRADLAPNPDAATTYFQVALAMRYERLLAGDCGQLLGIAQSYADVNSAFYDPVKALAWHQAAYRTGSPEAAAALGDAYVNGEGVEPDVVQARTYFLFAAESGLVRAMTQAAQLLLAERTPDANAAAAGLLEQAAQRGEFKAFKTLADIAAGEFGGEPDWTASVKYLEQGARAPDADASLLLALGRAQESGIGTAADPRAAYATYARAAEMGDGKAYLAMYNLTASEELEATDNPVVFLRAAANLGVESAMAELATVYACGTEVDHNASIADLWRGRAAAAGDSATLVSMGNRALIEVETGSQQYFRNIRRSAREGDAKSQILLSEAYRDGIGTAIDMVASQRWLEYALADETQHHEVRLALARQKLSQPTVGAAEVGAALDALSQADAGDASVRYEMAKIYLDGIGGTPVDTDIGTQYLLTAASQGYVSAMLRLASMDLPADQAGGKDAASWLQQAVDANSMTALLIQADLVKDPKRQRDLLDRALSYDSCNATELVSLAEALTKNGTYADVPRRLLTRALQIDSDDPATLLKLAGYLSAGVLHSHGEQQIFDMLHRAALGGEASAMRQMAGLYLRDAQIHEAKNWLVRAVANDEEAAIEDLTRLAVEPRAPDVTVESIIGDLRALSGADTVAATRRISVFLTDVARVDEQYQALALDWLVKSAEGGDPSAMMVLSNAYALGLWADQSMDESARWLKAAAEAGNVEAYEQLAVVLELGIGLPQDSVQAQTWLQRAVEVRAN